MKLSRTATAMALAGLLASPPILADGDEVAALRDQLQQLKSQMVLMEARLSEAEDAAAERRSEASPAMPEGATRVSLEPVVPDSVVHLAGYGAVQYNDRENADGGFGSLLFAPIFHYQYKDRLLFEGELEIEIEDDGTTEVALEYLTLDLMLSDNTTLLAGKFLSPVGQFRQNLHPSWINKLPGAPPGFGHDQAAPLADVGVQLRGGFGLGDGVANYALFAANGPQLEVEFEASDEHDDKLGLEDGDDDDDHGDDEPAEGEFEIHGLESEGFVGNDDGKLLFGGRVGFLPRPNLEVGLSLATGKVGLYGAEGFLDQEATRDLDVLGLDFYYAYDNLQLRGEFVTQEIAGNAASIVPGEAEWTAWYTQASYRLPRSKWEGVVRYADFDALEAHDDQEQVALGVNYLFSSNVIGKFAYEINDGETGTDADGDRFIVQLAYGF